MKDTLQRISTARAGLVLDHPFFGALALRLKLVEASPEVTDTMATDGRALYYSSAFVDSLKPSELLGLIAHEVMHPAMEHHVRREARDAERWNIACDLAINPLLRDAGFILPGGALMDPKFAGMSAEQIYNRLPAQEGNGGNGKAGSGLAKLPGAVIDAPEPTLDRGEWQLAVKNAARAARMMGRLPAAFAGAIADQTRARVNWRALLRRFVQQCASADYSWRMPNRRYIAAGLYLPQLRSESLPPIVVAIDTSDSISEATLAAFRTQVQSIVDECSPECTHVIYCSSKVAHVDTFGRGEPLTMKRHGRGGTDFRPVFDYVDAQSIEPACLIYLTDGEGHYPEQASAFPTLWAMTSARVAPWGETVRLEEEAHAIAA